MRGVTKDFSGFSDSTLKTYLIPKKTSKKGIFQWWNSLWNFLCSHSSLATINMSSATKKKKKAWLLVFIFTPFIQAVMSRFFFMNRQVLGINHKFSKIRIAGESLKKSWSVGWQIDLVYQKLPLLQLILGLLWEITGWNVWQSWLWMPSSLSTFFCQSW